MIEWLVDRMHVATPDAEVEADIRGRAARAGATQEQADEYVRIALERHHYNLAEYQWVMGSPSTTRHPAERDDLGGIK